MMEKIEFKCGKSNDQDSFICYCWREGNHPQCIELPDDKYWIRVEGVNFSAWVSQDSSYSANFVFAPPKLKEESKK